EGAADRRPYRARMAREQVPRRLVRELLEGHFRRRPRRPPRWTARWRLLEVVELGWSRPRRSARRTRRTARRRHEVAAPSGPRRSRYAKATPATRGRAVGKRAPAP